MTKKTNYEKRLEEIEKKKAEDGKKIKEMSSDELENYIYSLNNKIKKG